MTALVVIEKSIGNDGNWNIHCIFMDLKLEVLWTHKDQSPKDNPWE